MRTERLPPYGKLASKIFLKILLITKKKTRALAASGPELGLALPAWQKAALVLERATESSLWAQDFQPAHSALRRDWELARRRGQALQALAGWR